MAWRLRPGYPTRRVQTDRDRDGNRSILQVPGIYAVRYDYTQRNQLRTIYNGSWTPRFSYTYDAAGNMTKRQGVFDEGLGGLGSGFKS